MKKLKGSIRDVDKRIAQRLADQSAVGCDKSAPTVGSQEFVNLDKYGSGLMVRANE